MLNTPKTDYRVFANRLRRQRSLSNWIPGLSTLKKYRVEYHLNIMYQKQVHTDTLVLYFHSPAARKNTDAHSRNIQPYCLINHQIIYIHSACVLLVLSIIYSSVAVGDRINSPRLKCPVIIFLLHATPPVYLDMELRIATDSL